MESKRIWPAPVAIDRHDAGFIFQKNRYMKKSLIAYVFLAAFAGKFVSAVAGGSASTFNVGLRHKF